MRWTSGVEAPPVEERARTGAQDLDRVVAAELVRASPPMLAVISPSTTSNTARKRSSLPLFSGGRARRG